MITFKTKIEQQRAAINASASAGRIDPDHARLLLAALDHAAADIKAAGIFEDPTPPDVDISQFDFKL